MVLAGVLLLFFLNMAKTANVRFDILEHGLDSKRETSKIISMKR